VLASQDWEGPQAVSGVGHEAILAYGKDFRGRGAPLLATTLFVRKACRWFMLSAGGLKREPIAGIKDVGKRIADRL